MQAFQDFDDFIRYLDATVAATTTAAADDDNEVIISSTPFEYHTKIS